MPTLLLQAALAGLLAFAYVFVAWVVLPLFALAVFFRSKHVPQAFKLAVGSLLGLGVALVLVLGGVIYYAPSVPGAPQQFPTPRPLLLTLRQPHLLPYPLGTGQLEQARYDSICSLHLSGLLPRGERLRVHFEASPLASPLTTDLVEVWVDGQLATQASGQSVYHRATNSVSGKFSCVLPTGQPLSGSFRQTAFVLP